MAQSSFSDEKHFNLDGSDGFQHYWHELGQDFELNSKRQSGGQSIMVSGAFAYGGLIPLQFYPTRLNANGYVKVLTDADLVEN